MELGRYPESGGMVLYKLVPRKDRRNFVHIFSRLAKELLLWGLRNPKEGDLEPATQTVQYIHALPHYTEGCRY